MKLSLARSQSRHSMAWDVCVVTITQEEVSSMEWTSGPSVVTITVVGWEGTTEVVGVIVVAGTSITNPYKYENYYTLCE
jgi:hypothetical protein